MPLAAYDTAMRDQRAKTSAMPLQLRDRDSQFGIRPYENHIASVCR
jgi:hypothetical protein